MGTISKTVQYHMQSFWQKLIRLEELTQRACVNAENYFHESDIKYGTAELNLPAVVKPQIDRTAATPSLTTCREHRQNVDIFRGQSQMPPLTTQPGITQMMLRSETPKPQRIIAVLSTVVWTDLMTTHDPKDIEPVTIYPCIRQQ
jgi:hypothetical protein